MELKEGMYVRTKKGISKIDKERRIEYGMFHPVVDILKKEVIIKASYDIIDLIEVGDYVNGFRVVWKDNEHICINAYFEEDKIIRNNNEIKSIVTKEMYSSVEYRVEAN